MRTTACALSMCLFSGTVFGLGDPLSDIDENGNVRNFEPPRSFRAEPINRVVQSAWRLDTRFVFRGTKYTFVWNSGWGSTIRNFDAQRILEVKLSYISRQASPPAVMDFAYVVRNAGDTELLEYTTLPAVPGETHVFDAATDRSYGRLVYLGQRWNKGLTFVGWVARVVENGKTVYATGSTSELAKKAGDEQMNVWIEHFLGQQSKKR
ncbi:MAG TPA: hypothetical protein VIU12_25845 [Chryseolinea sp.]